MAPLVLEVVDRTGKTYMVPIWHLPFTLGRAEENDLPLTHSSVSRSHASIESVGDDLMVVDRGSRNHVFVNGQEIKKKVLRAGDRLRLGSIEMMVCRLPNIRVRGTGDRLAAVYVPQDQATNRTLLGEPSEAGDSGKAGTTHRDWRTLLQASLKSGTADIYGRAMEFIEEAVPFDRCYLLLFEGGAVDRLQVADRRFSAAHANSRDARAGDEVSVSTEILRRVAETREVVLVTEEDHDLKLRESFVSSGTRSALCFPLVIQDRVGGAFYMDRLDDPRAFSERDVEVLGPVVGLLSLKIENVQLTNRSSPGGPARS